PPLTSTLFPYTTLFRSTARLVRHRWRRLAHDASVVDLRPRRQAERTDGCALGVMSDLQTISATGVREASARANLEAPRRTACFRSEEHTSELQSLAYLV